MKPNELPRAHPLTGEGEPNLLLPVLLLSYISVSFPQLLTQSHLVKACKYSTFLNYLSLACGNASLGLCAFLNLFQGSIAIQLPSSLGSGRTSLLHSPLFPGIRACLSRRAMKYFPRAHESVPPDALSCLSCLSTHQVESTLPGFTTLSK